MAATLTRETVALAVEDLVVGYGDGPDIVRSVSLRIRAGERIGIIGETGSGKSTFGLALIRLLGPGGQIRGGRVRLGERDIARMSQRELRRVRGAEIALIYQDATASLDPVKTIGAQIREALRAHGTGSGSQGSARIAELLESVGIPADRASSYPHELSGGMRQRVSIAMALAQRPVLVIADEPTTALDVTTQAQVLALLNERVTNTDTALLLITHDLGVVADHCDTTAVMYAGTIVEQGPTRQVLRQPQHPYTEALVRSGDALLHSDAARLPVLTGAPPEPHRLGAGCAFAPRCPRRDDDPLCAQTAPPLQPADGDAGWAVACHHAGGGRP